MTTHRKIVQIYLHPGNLYIAKRPAIISTVLGSCVSVTFFDPKCRVGAMCHGRLPRYSENDDLSLNNNKKRFDYMDSSIQHILQSYQNKGIDDNRIIIKMFGGARVLGPISGKQNTIGCQNIKISKKVLQENGLHACFLDVGGKMGRKIAFNTQTGEVSSTLLQTREAAIEDFKKIQKQWVVF